MRRAVLLAAVVTAALLPATSAGAAQTTPYATLAPGFTQSIYATGLPFAGGIAFAPDGDVLLALSQLYRADAQTTTTVNGSAVHPVTTMPSAASLGLANSRTGGVYANTGSGVIKVDPATGATTGGPTGPAGGGLGIALDPQSGDLFYNLSNGGLGRVDAALTAGSQVGMYNQGGDGLAFDATGNFAFEASGGINVVKRDGTFVQHITQTGGCCADGMAFHASAPKFVVSVDTDGKLTRYDFPGDDYTQVPTQTVIASGGGRGDLAQVGSDGCLYLSMGNSTFADGTQTGQGSIVKVCGGFNPPVPVTTVLTANPAIVKVLPGLKLYLTLSAHLGDTAGHNIAGEPIAFSVKGAPVCTAKTDAAGNASCGGTLPGLLTTVLGLGYDARFAGDGNLQPSAAHGPLVQVGGIKVF
jgi:sugar lactone lactonase YvrE